MENITKARSPPFVSHIVQQLTGRVGVPQGGDEVLMAHISLSLALARSDLTVGSVCQGGLPTRTCRETTGNGRKGRGGVLKHQGIKNEGEEERG